MKVLFLRLCPICLPSLSIVILLFDFNVPKMPIHFYFTSHTISKTCCPVYCSNNNIDNSNNCKVIEFISNKLLLQSII